MGHDPLLGFGWFARAARQIQETYVYEITGLILKDNSEQPAERDA